MSLARILITLVVLLGVSRPAAALDPTAAIRVTPLLKTTTSWNGRPLTYPAGQAEVTGLQIEIAPGAETGWHEHPVPSFGLVLAGELEVTLKDGQVNRLHAGDALAEVVDTPHNGRNVGSEPVKLIVFYAGAVGQPLSRKAP